MSDNHKILVYEIKELLPHPNANSLSLINIDAYTVVVRTESWKDIKYGVYIPPDSIVPVKEEYAFLATDGTLSSLRDTPRYRVIRAKKLRGVVSFGLLMPLPSDIKNPYHGMDVTAHMEIEHYNPKAEIDDDAPKSGDQRAVKSDVRFGLFWPKLRNYPNHSLAHKTYELPNLRKIYSSLPRFAYYSASIKIHGSFCAYTYSIPTRKYRKGITGLIQKGIFGLKDRICKQDYTIMMKSKNFWKQQTKPIYIKAADKTIQPTKHVWERALEDNPGLIELIKKFPDHMIYGEVFGPIQKHYTYGHTVNGNPGPFFNKIQFRVFEIITPGGKRIDGPHLHNFLEEYDYFMVPLAVYQGDKLPSIEELDSLANDKSLIPNADHREEGLVLSFYDKNDELLLKAKFVGSKYLLGEYKLE